MLVAGPWVDWDCIVRILPGEGLEVKEAPQLLGYAFLIRGDAWPWPISKTTRLAGAEIRSIFSAAGLDYNQLVEFKEKYCKDNPSSSGDVLN